MERTDDLQFEGLKILQNPELFCFGTDAVLLANFVCARTDAKMVDLGTGTGIVPLLVYGRLKRIKIQAIEIQQELAQMAQKSVALNQLQDNIQVVCGNISGCYRLFGCDNDVVTINPPYEKIGAGEKRSNECHLISRFETLITFDEICAETKKLLKTGGSLYMIHRISRLAELFETMKKYAIEPKKMRFIHSTIKTEPKYVLIHAIKEGKAGLRVQPPLVLYDENGNETVELKKIYHRN
ncbi:MAG: tRNA1(Val) (adenine(37)-N6)-methyltransferase [Christensenellaceae bacterium]